MPLPAITVENLCKSYRLGLREEVPDTLVGAAKSMLKAPFRNLRRLRRLDTTSGKDEGDDTLWALRDVSFDVQEGEVLGIIGHNGAGKSTLLKILSRITEPSSGRVVIRGRVSSLLEVGTGFHPELTGRENVYMNGTILGMTKRQIDSKFDEIVEFSGVERFLDTPTKRYSSGMQVRLAFAVAAHLEPDILIVDEVLAVGDAEFQQKCIGKMQDVASGGRTVLFVSHNIPAVRNLCTRAVLLSAGQIERDETVEKALEYYLSKTLRKTSTILAERTDRSGSGARRLVAASVGSPTGPIMCGEPATFQFYFDREVDRSNLGFTIYSIHGTPVISFDSGYRAPRDKIAEKGVTEIWCVVSQLLLTPGEYQINVAIRSGDEIVDQIEGATRFTVVGNKFDDRKLMASTRWSSVTFPHRWLSSASAPTESQLENCTSK